MEILEWLETQVENPTVRIPSEQYGYIEATVTKPMTLADCFRLRDAIRRREMEKRYSCQHDPMFVQDLTTLKGKKYQECGMCGATRWQEKDGTWGMWRLPVKQGG